MQTDIIKSNYQMTNNYKIVIDWYSSNVLSENIRFHKTELWFSCAEMAQWFAKLLHEVTFWGNNSDRIYSIYKSKPEFAEILWSIGDRTAISINPRILDGTDGLVAENVGFKLKQNANYIMNMRVFDTSDPNYMMELTNQITGL